MKQLSNSIPIACSCVKEMVEKVGKVQNDFGNYSRVASRAEDETRIAIDNFYLGRIPTND